MVVTRSSQEAVEQLDVLVIGAGISGIDAGYHLSRDPSRTFAILEGRSEIGGTWSLFRYPGIRSDSEMFTLGFPFRPWTSRNSIAEGEEILQYVKDTAREFGIDEKIRFNHKVTHVNWSSKERLWTVDVAHPDTGASKIMKANFLFFASGYYNYGEGYYPELPGAKQFDGPILRPQFWPKDFDYAGKKVVVIGSGATAATLVPSMAKVGAKHVCMLQRSPSYFVSQPSVDPFVRFVRMFLPVAVAHHYLRIRNQLRQYLLVVLSHYFPNLVRYGLRTLAKRQLPSGYPMDPHFNPSYNPWDQRLCMVPDGDFFKAISSGKASIATGHIDTILPHTIRLKDGQEIEADIIVQATGLKVQLLGGTKVSVDGEDVPMAERFVYKGQMLNDVPNLSMVFVRIGQSCARLTISSPDR